MSMEKIRTDKDLKEHETQMVIELMDAFPGAENDHLWEMANELWCRTELRCYLARPAAGHQWHAQQHETFDEAELEGYEPLRMNVERCGSELYPAHDAGLRGDRAGQHGCIALFTGDIIQEGRYTLRYGPNQRVEVRITGRAIAMPEWTEEVYRQRQA